jgi:hypothetical protein
LTATASCRLWSFLVARSDPDASGTYSPSERQTLLSTLGYSPPSISSSASTVLSVSQPRRSSLSHLPEARKGAGLPEPKQTTLEFSSQDGYAFLGADEGMVGVPQIKKWPRFDGEGEEGEGENPVCTLDLVACFGDDFLSSSSDDDLDVSSVFTRIALEQPQCGDCLISLLVGKSGERGLEAFLPPASETDDEESGKGVEAQAIATEGRRWQELDFSKGVEGKGSLRSKVRFFFSFLFPYLTH